MYYLLKLQISIALALAGFELWKGETPLTIELGINWHANHHQPLRNFQTNQNAKFLCVSSSAPSGIPARMVFGIGKIHSGAPTPREKSPLKLSITTRRETYMECFGFWSVRRAFARDYRPGPKKPFGSFHRLAFKKGDIHKLWKSYKML